MHEVASAVGYCTVRVVSSRRLMTSLANFESLLFLSQQQQQQQHKLKHKTQPNNTGVLL